ncbi:GNAT family N-acetyltransferase [Candidatus Uabimicrobium amorphum]|uniref:N-acetyltransferase n=1 Tax=Uabimicrobium amorphum TaxID=2596890 RepID=A0A5S9ITH8_UABAM|nr:GNAT family N-acetyltransferase [Candidatus Uabimicrobium amorphum]BBM87261.1 N-acetyltransferase [Candidatus Uabimicrobium amorphum]
MLPRPFPFATPPNIETKRMILKPLTEEDLLAYHKICAEKETMRYYGLKPHQNIEDTRKTLEVLHKWFQANTAIRWGIFYKEWNDELVGDIGFWQFDVLRNRAEVGAKITMRCQGQGLGYEALAAVIDFGFTTLDLNGVDGNISEKNKASIGLVNKLGFRKIGVRPQLSYSIFEKCWQDMIFFSLNKQDWDKHE